MAPVAARSGWDSMRTSFSWFVGSLLLASTVAAVAAELPADRFGPADLARLAAVDEPAFAPDGQSDRLHRHRDQTWLRTSSSPTSGVSATTAAIACN